jgi:hypothetical protein
MTKYSRQGDGVVLGMGWTERLATGLVASALFTLLLVFGALTAALAIAGAVVIETKLWWLSRRRPARRPAARIGGTTLNAEYQIVPPEKSGLGREKPGTVGDEENAALRSRA